MLHALQSVVPGDCLLTGLCGIAQTDGPVSSGLMFLALGLVALGVVGFRSSAKGRGRR